MPKFNRRLALLAAVTLPLALGLPAGGARRGPDADLPRGAAERPGRSPPRARPGTRRRSGCRRRAPGCCPTSRLTGNANYNDGRTTINARAALGHRNTYQNYNVAISASQPLFRMQNSIAFDQAKQQVAQADYVLALGAAGPDRCASPSRTSTCCSPSSTSSSPRRRRRRCPSSSRRRSATSRSAWRRSPTPTRRRPSTTRSWRRRSSSRNDLDNKRTALRAIIGRFPKELKKLGPGFEPQLPEPNVLDAWVERALRRTSRCASRSTTSTSRRSRSTAPAPATTRRSTWSAATATAPSDRLARQRLRHQRAHRAPSASQLNVPIYQGGFVNSRVREALALQERFAAGPRDRAPQRAVQRADRLLRRQQRGRVGQGDRAGGDLGADRARVEQARPGGRRAHQPRRAERPAERLLRRAATSRRPTSTT